MRFAVLMFLGLLVCFFVYGQESQEVQALIERAEKGDAAAEYDLGVMYGTKGLWQDYNKAFFWYKKSAENGFVLARLHLGECYSMGKGVQQDYILGYVWFTLAIGYGFDEADKAAKYTATKLSPVEMIKAEELSKAYHLKYVEPFQK